MKLDNIPHIEYKKAKMNKKLLLKLDDNMKYGKKVFNMMFKDYKYRYIYYGVYGKQRVMNMEYKSILRVFNAVRKYYHDNGEKEVRVQLTKLYGEYLSDVTDYKTYTMAIFKLTPAFFTLDTRFPAYMKLARILKPTIGMYMTINYLDYLDTKKLEKENTELKLTGEEKDEDDDDEFE